MVPDLLRVVPLKLHVRNSTQTNGEAPVYELFCRWRNETTKPGDSCSYREWSTWQTFDAFQAFDASLRAQRGCMFAKMMVTVAFAPEHKVRMFFHQHQTARFLEKRQKELDYYMQRILLFSGVCEFAEGTGSRVLAEFVGADKHVDCSQLPVSVSTGVPRSPTALLLEQHAEQDGQYGNGLALRTLNVDMHAAFSPAHSYASSASFDKYNPQQQGGGGVTASRKAVKQEIEDELVLRFGEHQLKRFRKRARAFRKENDPSVAVQDLTAYVATEYDAEFASWLLPRFLKTIKPEDKKSALREACGDALLSDRDDAASRKARKDELKKMQRAASSQSMTGGSSNNCNPAASSKLSRKKSSKEILTRVEKYARGNADVVESFKVAAKALGNQEMTTTQFVSFVRATFGRADAQEILFLVVDVVPLPHVQRELRDVLAI